MTSTLIPNHSNHNLHAKQRLMVCMQFCVWISYSQMWSQQFSGATTSYCIYSCIIYSFYLKFLFWKNRVLCIWRYILSNFSFHQSSHTRLNADKKTHSLSKSTYHYFIMWSFSMEHGWLILRLFNDNAVSVMWAMKCQMRCKDDHE
jgi:hypothetical protein